MDLVYTFRCKPVTQRPYMVSRGWEECPQFYIDPSHHVTTIYQVFRKQVDKNTYN